MKKLMIALVACAMASSLLAEPQERAEGHRRGPNAPRQAQQMMGMGQQMDPLVRAVMNPKIAEKLGLTEEQQAKIKELAPKRGENGDQQEKVRKGMKKQMELLAADKVDEAAVMAAIDEVFEARKEIAKAQTKRLIAVRSVLTGEQIAKAKEMMKQFAPRRPAGRKGPNAEPAAPAEPEA